VSTLTEYPEFRRYCQRRLGHDPDYKAEWLWRKKLRELHYPVSGRLKIVAHVAPIASGQAKGVPRVLTLCACGGTKVCQLMDF
jgi:hypothetical protein